MNMTRKWAMPHRDTFKVKTIREFVEKHVAGCEVIVDPFARNCKIGTITNDLNPETSAQYHMDAIEFCSMLVDQGVMADAVIFDPPYSNTQISRTYKNIGRKCTMKDTHNGALYAGVRKRLSEVLKPGGVALSFGWNSCSFPGCDMTEILLVSHGGAHNDTICVAHRKKVMA